jgi:8-oxo-dGTP diphosphatase
MSKPGSESVLGFAFTPDEGPDRTRWVVLIKKDHPPWAADKFNGVGGAVEPPEEPRDAMAREFLEETGVVTRPEDWRLVALVGRAAERTMYVYATALPGPLTLKQDGPEPCYWVPVDKPPSAILPNLQWLIPLCLDDRVTDVVSVPYRGRSAPH